MADESEVTNLEVEPIEAEAKELGWTPKEEWKGNPDRWVDAKTFVERGATILPIVQKNNKEMQRQLQQQTQQITALTNELRASAASLKAIEESHAADLEAQVKATKAEIGKQLKAAKEEGDIDLELKLIEQLSDLRDAEKEAKRETKTAPAPKSQPEVVMTPESIAWQEANPWINTDQKRARRAILLAQEIAEDHPELRGKGKAFYDKLDEELRKLEGTSSRRPAEDKVSSGRPSGGGGSGKSYSDLPPEAKQACDSQAKKLVGPDRAHKDMASWRASYARQYFAD